MHGGYEPQTNNLNKQTNATPTNKAVSLNGGGLLTQQRSTAADLINKWKHET